MDSTFRYQGQTFVWNLEKAALNQSKHGVSFERACEVFFDPFLRMVNAGTEEEPRIAALEVVMPFRVLVAGSRFCSYREARSEEYRASSSDE